MSRCVVCGALPVEQCNQDTHDAHYRMWSRFAGWGDSRAQQMVDAIDRARAGKRMVA